MRKFDLRKFVFLLLLLGTSSGAWAQTPLIWGSSPFQDSLWSTDTTTYTIVNRVAPSLAGFTITGMNGIAWDPITHQTYVIMKVSGVSGRVLGTMDLPTGVCTQIGNLGDNFASISFREDGQLFGVTGDGATVPETMYLIDKTNATKVVAAALGAGVDGEVICYNYDDDFFYHWSGNGTVIMEKVMSVAPYTATNIPISGAAGGETFGAIYIGNSTFIISNISSNLKHVNTSGAYSSTTLSNNPDDLRGLVMPPSASFSADTICQGDSATWNLMPGQARDSAVYHWGDGTSTVVFPAASATHTYTTAGSFTTYMVLKNDTVGEDTLWSAPIRVNALPLVALVPGTDTIMCFADSLNLVATNGGTSQWYMNGAPIVSATTPNLTVTTNGVYNMIKINQNGCQDSSATGVAVVFGDQPVADLGADSTICDGDTLCFGLNNPGDVTYLWSTGSTTSFECVTSSGTYSVAATDSVGCVATDTVAVTVLLTPTPSVNIDTTGCPTVIFTVTDPNGTSWDWDFGDGGTASGNPVTHVYTSNGVYNGTITASNACFTVVDSGTVTINCIIGVENGLANAVHIAPNPSNGSFMLTAALPTASSLSYEISDLNGRILMTQRYDDVRSNWSEVIDFHGAAGLYFLSVKAGEDMAVYRLVIQ
jgi:PKD repeat protein